MTPQPNLCTADIIDLGLLGLAALHPMPFAALVMHLQSIGAPHFMPTTAVIEDRIAALAAAGNLAGDGVPHLDDLLIATAAGRRRLQRLICTPGPPGCAAQRDLAFLFKLCLLDAIALPQRQLVLQMLAAERRTALAAAERVRDECRAGNGYARLWLGHQVERLRADVAWLQTLASDGPAPAGPHRLAG